MLVELDEGKSRTVDVEDEEVPELADTLGITKGTQLSVSAKNFLPLLGQL